MQFAICTFLCQANSFTAATTRAANVYGAVLDRMMIHLDETQRTYVIYVIEMQTI